MKFRDFKKRTFRKNEETWSHDIIMSKKDLKDWLTYEKKLYKSISFCGRFYATTEDDFIWNYQKRLRRTEYYLNTGKKIRYMLSRIKLTRKTAKLGLNIRLNIAAEVFV